MQLSQHISLLLSGFGVFASIILMCAYVLFLPNMRKTFAGKISCICLLSSLCVLQIAHYSYFIEQAPLIEYRQYGLLLTVIPSTFYFFSREVLYTNTNYALIDVIHGVPILLALFLPISVLPAFAFMFGTAYTFWFTRIILKLRGQGGRFKFELFFFGMFAVMALVSLILGLSLSSMDPHVFYTAYGNSISISLLLIVAALLFFPELLSDILLITELAYSKSKLNDVDTESKLHQLQQIMQLEKQYQNENLSLSNVADSLELSSHQLSELINSHFDFGFPRYIREQRVKAAKQLLLAEPDASILSISMEVGFKSQSNFYTAFKEITDLSPGQFRKKNS